MIRNIPFGKPLIGNAEKEAVLNVLSNTQLVHGEKCKEFENAFQVLLEVVFVQLLLPVLLRYICHI